MKFSKLNEIPGEISTINTFLGYNHNIRIREGEFFDMKNLSSSDFPLLSPRKKRGVYKYGYGEENGLISALLSKDDLWHIEGRNLYKNKILLTDSDGNPISLDNNFPKQLVSMGAYIIILPDKVYINTKDDNLIVKKIEDQYESKDGEIVGVTLCDIEGTPFENPILQEDNRPIPILDGPSMPYDIGNMPSGMYWIDTSNDPVLKIYDSDSKEWKPINRTYLKISVDKEEGNLGIDDIFDIKDGVSITAATNFKGEIKTVYAKGTGLKDGYPTSFIIVDGIGKAVDFGVKNLVVSRSMPDMDFIFECGNRLWGCKYDGSINEIYASKLGDFKNWRSYDGVSTDSYSASVGTDGPFTGAISYQGYPIFFKENWIHKVYGNYPANYQIQTTSCRGVQEGCSKSLAVVNDALFYKSRSGICIYNGSIPEEISSVFGGIRYSDAAAGCYENKYYISMKDNCTDTYHMCVYDYEKGLLHKEDETRVTQFCNHNGELYYIDYDKDTINTVVAIAGTDNEQGPVIWEATSGIIGTDMPDKKYVSRLVVRLTMEYDSAVTFFIEYDSSGEWEHLFTMDTIALRTFSIPVRPRRCDHLRLRIKGSGMSKIFSITKFVEQGSET